MELAELYRAQRVAFEQTYEDDDWSRMEPYFHDDVVYEVMNVPFNCVVAGRDNVFAAIRRSVTNFDKQCVRELGLNRRAYVEGSNFLVHSSLSYRRADSPPIELFLWEIATFREGKIARLIDLYDAGSRELLAEWNAKWGEGLDASYV
jgi:hypothetical protein